MSHTSDNLGRQYRQRFSGGEAYRNAVWRILCARFFSHYIPAGARVLDVGSGWGEFINHIAAAEKHAMDLNRDGAARVAGDVNFICQDCSTPWPFVDGALDVVFTSNFLEHLPDKPSIERTVAEASRCLKTGGQIICLGPNIKCVQGDYWDFWDHHIPLTEKSCAELLQLSGFDLAECRARFLPYSMSNGARPPLFLVSLYLRLPVFWPLFGKQFLVIGRKAQQ